MKNKNKIKIRKSFIIMYSVWLIDFILTFIALNLMGDFYEVNKLASFFFKSPLGWVLFPLLAFGVIYSMSFGFEKLVLITDNKYKRFKKLIIPLGISLFVLIEFSFIFHNLFLILK